MKILSSSFAILLVILLVTLFSPYYANAQECRPSDFTFADLEKINFSDAVRDAGYFLLDETKRRDFRVGIGGQYGSYRQFLVMA